MKTLLSTKEVAQLLDINEKMVYSLIAEKNLPATKVTGKWLFPSNLVEQWIAERTINRPVASSPLPPYHGLLIIAGSNDILLDRNHFPFQQLVSRARGSVRESGQPRRTEGDASQLVPHSRESSPSRKRG